MMLLLDALFVRTEAMLFIWSILLAILSIAFLSYESDLKEKYLSFSLKTSPKYALTLAFISLVVIASVAFLFVFIGKMYAADILMGAAIRIDNQQGQVSEDGSIARIYRAISLNNHEGRYYTRLGQEYMVLVNQEMAKDQNSRDINKIQFYLNAAIQASKQGETLYKSNDVTSTEALAQIYENSGIYVTDGLTLPKMNTKKPALSSRTIASFYVSLGTDQDQDGGQRPEQ